MASLPKWYVTQNSCYQNTKLSSFVCLSKKTQFHCPRAIRVLYGPCLWRLVAQWQLWNQLFHLLDRSHSHQMSQPNHCGICPTSRGCWRDTRRCLFCLTQRHYFQRCTIWAGFWRMHKSLTDEHEKRTSLRVHCSLSLPPWCPASSSCPGSLAEKLGKRREWPPSGTNLQVLKDRGCILSNYCLIPAVLFRIIEGF